jgi:hypothetical protein
LYCQVDVLLKQVYGAMIDGKRRQLMKLLEEVEKNINQ